MSRSYRKPFYVDGYGSKYKKYAKRYASRAIRRAVDVPNGKSYRKFFESWNICDYKYVWNPRPRVRWGIDGPELVDPEPEWKVRMK